MGREKSRPNRATARDRPAGLLQGQFAKISRAPFLSAQIKVSATPRTASDYPATRQECLSPRYSE
jgi:hypothetical protein